MGIFALPHLSRPQRLDSTHSAVAHSYESYVNYMSYVVKHSHQFNQLQLQFIQYLLLNPGNTIDI